MDLTIIMKLKEAFDAANIDKDNSLDLQEFEAAFGEMIAQGASKKEVKRLFMKIDADANGSVDWKEFMNYILLENETLSSMKVKKFSYEKTQEADPKANKEWFCHKKMISDIIVLPAHASYGKASKSLQKR